MWRRFETIKLSDLLLLFQKVLYDINIDLRTVQPINPKAVIVTVQNLFIRSEIYKGSCTKVVVGNPLDEKTVL